MTRRDQLVESVTAGILRLRETYGIAVTEAQARERARNMVAGFMMFDFMEAALKDPPDPNPEWVFPWREPRGIYDTDGPETETKFMLGAVTYAVTPTGDAGSCTGRDRFRAYCLTCSKILHANTTGPSGWIRDHHREQHRDG